MNKVVKFYTIRNSFKKDSIENIEFLIQKDINEEKNSCIYNTRHVKTQLDSKNPDNIKDIILTTEKKKFDLTEAIILYEDTLVIRKALSSHFLFSNLSEEIIDLILTQIIILEVKKDMILFQEGDNGNFFYIVKKGEFSLSIKDREETKKIFKNGDTFGELSLIQKNKRSGTVICKEDGMVYFLEGSIFREIVQKINKQFLKERIYFLSLIPLFKGLNQIQIQNLANNMIKCEYKEDYIIVPEGEIGESLFIIREGVVSCVKNNTEIRKLYEKDYFGESSILFETKRTLSIYSVSKTICYNITKNVLIETLGDNFKSILLSAICKEAFFKSTVLQGLLLDDSFSRIFKNFSLKFYENNQVVINKAESMGKKIIVLIEGNLSNNHEVVCERGYLYGDKLLKSKVELSYNILAVSDSIALEAEWSNITKSLTIEFEEKKFVSVISRINDLKKMMIFKNLSYYRLFEICKKMGKRKYKEGEIIIQENLPGERLYLIKRGRVQIKKNNKLIRELEDGSLFGEKALLLNINHSATVIALGEVSIYTLSKEDFFIFFDKKMQEFIINKMALQDNNNIQLEDLYYVKSLGEGKFGSVSLVHNTKNLYAIKAVLRKIADRRKVLIKYFQKERRILLSLDHPFIIKLVKTLKGNNHIFFLMEYVNGIVLSRYIDDYSGDSTKLRNKYATQFFIANLLITIDYLNKKKIAHRDIKPDNIMISDNGFLKLIDFGTAIIIKDFTTTLTGTPNYIAPEVLLGKGYGFSCDYWSIGITAFELYFNYYPFGNDALEPMEVYRDILRNELKFPHLSEEEESFSVFVSALLKKKVTERVCNIEIIKEMKFYEFFSFNELAEFRLKPPYIPEINSNVEHLLSNLKTKYLNKLETNKKKEPSNPSSEEEDNNGSGYDKDWAEEF